jgi:hypothetical protein
MIAAMGLALTKFCGAADRAGVLRRIALLLLVIGLCLGAARAPAAQASPGMRLGIDDDSFLYWMDPSFRYRWTSACGPCA